MKLALQCLGPPAEMWPLAVARKLPTWTTVETCSFLSTQSRPAHRVITPQFYTFEINSHCKPSLPPTYRFPVLFVGFFDPQHLARDITVQYPISAPLSPKLSTYLFRPSPPTRTLRVHTFRYFSAFPALAQTSRSTTPFARENTSIRE
jgi:hypothetical protein